jgi:hypothetical protein
MNLFRVAIALIIAGAIVLVSTLFLPIGDTIKQSIETCLSLLSNGFTSVTGENRTTSGSSPALGFDGLTPEHIAILVAIAIIVLVVIVLKMRPPPPEGIQNVEELTEKINTLEGELQNLEAQREDDQTVISNLRSKLDSARDDKDEEWIRKQKERDKEWNADLERNNSEWKKKLDDSNADWKQSLAEEKAKVDDLTTQNIKLSYDFKQIDKALQKESLARKEAEQKLSAEQAITEEFRDDVRAILDDAAKIQVPFATLAPLEWSKNLPSGMIVSAISNLKTDSDDHSILRGVDEFLRVMASFVEKEVTMICSLPGFAKRGANLLSDAVYTDLFLSLMSRSRIVSTGDLEDRVNRFEAWINDSRYALHSEIFSPFLECARSNLHESIRSQIIEVADNVRQRVLAEGHVQKVGGPIDMSGCFLSYSVQLSCMKNSIEVEHRFDRTLSSSDKLRYSPLFKSLKGETVRLIEEADYASKQAAAILMEIGVRLADNKDVVEIASKLK